MLAEATCDRNPTVLIGGYSVAIYAAETHVLCPGTGSDCSDPDERDVAVVVPAP